MTLGDKVTTELLRCGRGNGTCRTVRFQTVTVGRCRVVEEQGIDSVNYRQHKGTYDALNNTWFHK